MISIRCATIEDAAGIAIVHVDTWRTTYRGIVSHEKLDNLSYERCEKHWRKTIADPNQDDCIFVAESDGNIVGFSYGFAERTGENDYDAEIGAIYILSKYQRKGIGRKLTDAVARCLKQRGYRSVLIWVLKENHSSRAFYEAMGGKIVLEKELTFDDGNTYKVVGYGWENIDKLNAE